MKKLFSVLFFVSVSSFAFAANNIKMVTYFPVPYASYQHLDVEKTLDVGVMSCAMDLRCAGNQYALNVYEDVNPGSSVLKKGYLRVTAGLLNLNSSGKAVSKVMSVGSQSGTGGELSFGQDLRINQLSNRGQSLQAANESNVVSALRMFPEHITNNFPACSGVEGAPDVSWQRLELGAADGKAVSNVFLVCGNPMGGEAEQDECTAGQKELADDDAKFCDGHYRVCGSDGKWGAYQGGKTRKGIWKKIGQARFYIYEDFTDVCKGANATTSETDYCSMPMNIHKRFGVATYGPQCGSCSCPGVLTGLSDMIACWNCRFATKTYCGYEIGSYSEGNSCCVVGKKLLSESAVENKNNCQSMGCKPNGEAQALESYTITSAYECVGV